MNSFEEVFENVKKYCEEKTSKVAMDTWIRIMKPVKLEKQTAYFQVETEFQQNVILDTYSDLIKEAFQSVLGFDVDLDVQIAPQNNAVQNNELDLDSLDEKTIEEAEKTYFSSEYAYTFDTFIVGKSNDFAYATCTAVAKDPGKNYNPLFIYGDAGLGKTHLMHAIAYEVKKNFPQMKVVYVTSEEFLNEFITQTKNGNMRSFREKYRESDLLLIDDIQFFQRKEQVVEEFFNTFNALRKEDRQIVITSDRPPKELTTLNERLISRFEEGLLVDIYPPELETRIAIIQRKAERMNITIPDDIVRYIAEQLKTNIRQLEGAVKKLGALSHLAGSPITLSLTQNVIRDILRDSQPVSVVIDNIIKEVATMYNVNPEDIRGKKHPQQVSAARKVAVYVVQQVTKLNLNEIAKEFGNRDHSTIVYLLKDIKESMDGDPHLKDTIDDMINRIQGKT